MCTGYFGEIKTTKAFMCQSCLMSPNQKQLKDAVKSMNTQSPLELQKKYVNTSALLIKL